MANRPTTMIRSFWSGHLSPMSHVAAIATKYRGNHSRYRNGKSSNKIKKDLKKRTIPGSQAEESFAFFLKSTGLCQPAELFDELKCFADNRLLVVIKRCDVIGVKQTVTALIRRTDRPVQIIGTDRRHDMILGRI